MSSRFAAVLLDEDVAVVVAAMLRGRGFDAVTTLDERQTGSSDEEQLAYASAEGRVLVTHNRADFVRLASQVLASGGAHAGVLVCRRRAPRALADRISRVLHTFGREEFRNLLLHA